MSDLAEVERLDKLIQRNIDQGGSDEEYEALTAQYEAALDRPDPPPAPRGSATDQIAALERRLAAIDKVIPTLPDDQKLSANETRAVVAFDLKELRAIAPFEGLSNDDLE